MERLLGAVAAVFTWLGWLAVCPALGFPALASVAMVNRALFGTIDPGFWVGWIIVIAALLLAIAALFTFERAHLVRADIRTGVIYGVALWLFAGLIVMPLLGLFETSSPVPAIVLQHSPPDPMHATVMMHSLGPLASLASLIAWVLFGAIVGATGSEQRRQPAPPGISAR